MEIFWGLVLIVIAVLFAVILVRTLLFRPKPNAEIISEEILFDGEKAADNLRELVRCKTVSYRDSSLEDDAEFQKLTAMLPKLYPNVFASCSLQELPDRALLFKWEGKNHNAPTVLMAHYDVVPVDESGWDKPPFDAILEDGVIWGRGTLDTKVTFNGVLFSADTLISQGFVPENDIYFAFSGGEEVNGNGAANIVDWFENNKITPALVVDEGGAVVENVFPGVKKPCGLIGIAEKGIMNVEYSCKSGGGHASAPKPHTPLIELSSACLSLEFNPFKYRITEPVRAMFDTLGRHSTFVYRMIFANLWAFGWVLNLICKSSGGELNALLRTTVAFTQAMGSSTENVIPSEAKMVSNIRLNVGETVDSAMERIKRTINNDRINIKVINGVNPSRISVSNGEAWDKVASAVASTWEGSIVSPYLMMQCSDSRHYGRISDKVYRFSAMDLTTEERATIHGNNERIRIETLEKAVEFYIRLIKQC